MPMQLAEKSNVDHSPPGKEQKTLWLIDSFLLFAGRFEIEA